jgi:hypothetical protein
MHPTVAVVWVDSGTRAQEGESTPSWRDNKSENTDVVGFYDLDAFFAGWARPGCGWNAMERHTGMKKLFIFALASTVAVTATVFGLPASPALATPIPSSTVLVSGRFSPNGADPMTSNLFCPAGYRMVGSGGFGGGAGRAIISALVPTADFTGASLFLTVVHPSSDLVASMEVRCAPADQFADVRTSILSDFGVQPGSFRQGIVRCRPGYYAFGGGGYFTTTDNDRILVGFNNSANAPTGDGTGWIFAGTAPSNAHRLVVVTQCAPPRSNGSALLVQSGTVSTNRLAPISSLVTCPSGFRTIAGGFYVANPDGSVSSSADVQQSMESTVSGTRSWFVIGSSPPGTKLVALAQCG